MSESAPPSRTAPEELVALIEALFLAIDEPLSMAALAELVGGETPLPLLEDAVEQFRQRLARQPFMTLRPSIAEGERRWQLTGTAELAPYLARRQTPRTGRYSRAVMETLALIVWRQPITRGEIEAVRGVSVNPQILRTLTERGWIRAVGHKQTPGRPELLGTTPRFLADFGLTSLDQLPDFDQFVSQGEIDV